MDATCRLGTDIVKVRCVATDNRAQTQNRIDLAGLGHHFGGKWQLERAGYPRLRDVSDLESFESASCTVAKCGHDVVIEAGSDDADPQTCAVEFRSGCST